VDGMSAKKETDIQKIAKIMSEELGNIIASAKNPSEDARAPFTEQTNKPEEYGKLISRPKSELKAKKPMKGFQTYTFLDNLFLGKDDKPLGGIPIVGQLGLVGLSGCGKSIMVQEIALRVASSGKKVVFVTSEDMFDSSTPRNDLQSRMKQKAEVMNLDWDMIRANLFVFDTITHTELRDWWTFVRTYRYIVEILGGIDLLIVDSITLMEQYTQSLKRRVMELSSYNQLRGITAIYVCQRAEEEADKFNMRGGMGLAHNLDIVLCVDMKKAIGRLKADLNKKQWELCHFVRILACRLGGHDKKYFEVDITSDGFLKLKVEE